MLVRFGYAAIAFGIKNGSPDQTVTLEKLNKLEKSETRRDLLRKVLKQNLAATRRILCYNRTHQIRLYRITSKLVPLATHPAAAGWDYIAEFSEEFAELGRLAREGTCRLTAHPDHRTILNSPKPEILAAALRDLDYHDAVFRALGYPPEPQLVLHAGRIYKNKKQSSDRFCRQFSALPTRIRQRIMLENDDKAYAASDVLALCKTVGAPMLLDVHHHYCLNNAEKLSKLWPDIVSTWGGHLPKIHISSPKSEKHPRNHADMINVQSLLPFLTAASKLDHDVDVMVEAKGKDRALFALLNDLERIPGIKRVEEAAIII